MQTRPFGTLRRFVSTLSIAATVVMPYAAYVPAAHAADTLFSNGFESMFTGWSSVNAPQWDTTSSSPYEGSRKAKIDGNTSGDDVLQRNQSTAGYENIVLRYAWRVDKDLESSDELEVQWYDGSTWHTLVNYDSTGVTGWAVATHNLPAGADDESNFRIRFKATDFDDGNDRFELDAVTLTGDPIAQPDLVAVKSDNTEADAVVPGGTFQWKIRVENIGDGNAVFGNNDVILVDQMPAGDDFADYSLVDSTPSGTGISGSGDIRCSLTDGLFGWDDNEDLTCWADDGTVTFGPGGFFDVFVNVDLNPSASGVITNPRADRSRFDESNGICQVDPYNEVIETIETIGGNNYCGDSIAVEEEGPATGTLIVRKLVPGVENPDYASFSFQISPGSIADVDASVFPFDDSGSNSFTMNPGEYLVTEVAGEEGYTVTYGEGCSGIIVAGNTYECTITNTTVPPAKVIVRKVAQGQANESDVFSFQLRELYGEGSSAIGDTSIAGPDLPDSFFDVFFNTEEDARNLRVQESAVAFGWDFQSVLCWEGSGPRPEASPEATPTGTPEVSPSETPPLELDTQTLLVVDEGISFTYADTGAEFTLTPGDVVTCEFTNRERGGSGPQTGTLVVEKYIRGGSLSFDEFRFEVDGGSLGFNGYFDESGRNTFENAPVGEYSVSEESPEGYTATYGGDCDETGVVSVANDETSTCRVTNTADGWEEGDGETGPEPTDDPDSGGGSGDDDGNLGTLIVKKVILFGEDASVSFSDFGFSVASMSAQFEEDGENELQLEAGDYTVAELDAPGFTNAFSGDCDENGNVLVPEGATKVCTITNTAGVGGFNPGSDIPAPIETPTPTPTPTPTGTGGGVTGGSLGGPAGENDDTPASESAPASPSADSLLTASIGSMGDFPLCVPGGLWWVLVNLVLYFLALLWLQRGEFNLGKAVIVLVLLAAVLIWVANACTNNPLWLPAALSVLALLWLRLRGRKDA